MLPRRWSGREPVILVCVIVAVALGAALVLFRADHYAFLYFGDGSAHLVRARQFVDSQVPGIHNLGTAWLPFPHLLLLPPALADALFFSGAAGLVVGIPCLLASAVVLFLLTLRLSGSRPSAFVAALLFALNPNVLYLALTPMTEAIFLLLFVGAAYGFLRWWDGGGTRWLTGASVAVMLATLTRYEAWILAPVILLGVFLRQRRSSLPPRDRAAVYGSAGLSAVGIALWLVWNLVEYSNPVDFAVKIGQAGHPEVRAALAYHPVPVLDIYVRTALHMYGPLLMVLAGAGAFHLVRRGFLRDHAPILVFLSLPALFTLLSLFLGFALMDGYWWNSRYVITLAIPLYLCTGILLASLETPRISPEWAVLIAGLLLFPLFQLTSPRVDVVTYRDAVQNFFDRTVLATETGKRLGEEYRGGTIALITGSVQGQRIVLPAGIPLRRYYMPFDQEPDSTCPDIAGHRYIVIAKQPSYDAGPCRTYWLERREYLARYYSVGFENSDFLLLVKRFEGKTPSNHPAGWNGVP